ncbi:MAG: hypothetical protein IIB94_10860 [Candidatus Marinimicrobia bacterium]|nr:hypothetical protein [Candidatus Neomarinimicrobiota bacterium]
MLGISDSTTSGSFIISDITDNSFILTATGQTEGIKVRATISAWGIVDGSLKILNF